MTKPLLYDLLREVCQRHKITLEQIRGPQRFKHLVNARREFSRIAMGCGYWSPTQIGMAVNRDRTTILHHGGALSGSKNDGAGGFNE